MSVLSGNFHIPLKTNKVHIKILGTGAGGGVPQWNCNCPNCKKARIKDNKVVLPRTQSSIALSANQKDWVLINASPDIRTQINRNKSSFKTTSLRKNTFKDIILVDSQIDHTTGLLTMREGDPLNVFCTENTHHDLTNEFPIFKILDSFCGVNYNEIKINTSLFVQDIMFTFVDIKSNAPPYSTSRDKTKPGTNIGIIIYNPNTNKSLFYAPGIEEINDDIKGILSQVDIVLIDGTCWTNNELIDIGVSKSNAVSMGHKPQTDMIHVFKEFPKLRKILIHINNTNPICDKTTKEYAKLIKNNIEVSEDDMDIFL